MKKRQLDTAFTRTLSILLVLLVIVLVANRGRSIVTRPPQLDFVNESKSTSVAAQKPEITLITQDETPLLVTVKEALGQMKIGWKEIRASRYTSGAQGDCGTVLICASDLTGIDSEALVSLIRWVEDGGRLALMTAPVTGTWFQVISQKTGIIDTLGSYYMFSSIRFEHDLLPLMNDEVYDQNLQDYALAVHLDADCTVYIKTADEAGYPILWSRELGEGRIAVFNTSLIQGKDSRSYVLNVLQALEDVLVYPVINAGMVFIDDFPAPQPEGYDQRLREQYGVDVQGFFRNYWWPDMKALHWQYGLEYTGVLVETYNDTVEPPFEPDNEERALIRYYMSELLHSGGEVGLHGYNHQPLCPEGFDYSGANYTGWPDKDYMRDSIKELARFGTSFLPEARFTAYVPPSNYLCPIGQEALLEAVPDIKTISGLYLPAVGVAAHVQEFREEEDGTISTPRITSGYSLDAYNKLMMAKSLLLHGVVSHFIHPDDVLDDERGAMLGWSAMFSDFSAAVEKIKAAYPMLRWCTASEGAAAVQRYDRLSVRRKIDGNRLTLTLEPFYDEVWLALHTKTAPETVTNGVLHKINDGFYWLQAQGALVSLEWGTP